MENSKLITDIFKLSSTEKLSGIFHISDRVIVATPSSIVTLDVEEETESAKELNPAGITGDAPLHATYSNDAENEIPTYQNLNGCTAIAPVIGGGDTVTKTTLHHPEACKALNSADLKDLTGYLSKEKRGALNYINLDKDAGALWATNGHILYLKNVPDIRVSISIRREDALILQHLKTKIGPIKALVQTVNVEGSIMSLQVCAIGEGYTFTFLNWAPVQYDGRHAQYCCGDYPSIRLAMNEEGGPTRGISRRHMQELHDAAKAASKYAAKYTSSGRRVLNSVVVLRCDNKIFVKNDVGQVYVAPYATEEKEHPHVKHDIGIDPKCLCRVINSLLRSEEGECIIEHRKDDALNRVMYSMGDTRVLIMPIRITTDSVEDDGAIWWREADKTKDAIELSIKPVRKTSRNSAKPKEKTYTVHAVLSALESIGLGLKGEKARKDFIKLLDAAS